MSDDQPRYIIPERVRDLQEGSYEDRARAVREWVDEHVGGAVLATREESFVAVDPDGVAREYQCEWDGSGLEVVGEQILEDVAVTRAEMGRYVCDRIREVSSAVVDGDVDAARRKLEDVEAHVENGARGWWLEGLADEVDAIGGGAWRDLLAESRHVSEAAIRTGVDLDRYDHRGVVESSGESVLIRGSVQEIMVDADSLADRVEESAGADDGIDDAARSLASDLGRLVDLVERAEPYLAVSPDEAVEALRDAAARALYECARGYAAIEGQIHGKRNARGNQK